MDAPINQLANQSRKWIRRPTGLYIFETYLCARLSARCRRTQFDV